MKLSMELIADALCETFEVVNSNISSESIELEQVRLYTGGTTFLPGIVYAANGAELTEKPFFEGFCAIVSIGPSNKRYPDSGCDYIEIKKDTPLFEVLNCIQDVYKKYQKWVFDMYEALSNKDGIQKLLNLSLPLLENPIYLHDKNYHIIAYAEAPNMPGGDDIYNIEKSKGWMSLEDMNILKDTPYFEKTFDTTKPTFHIDAGEFSYIYDNMRYKGEYWGRLYVDERVRNFKKGDYAVVGILSSMIEKALAGRNISLGKTYRGVEEKLVSLLDGNSINIAALDEELRRTIGKDSISNFCFYMQLKEADLLLNTAINICELIESRLPDCTAFPYKTGIIGLVPASCRLKTSERVREVLQEFELYAGVSLLFENFADFPLYFKQAEIALKYGVEENSSEWIHHFEEYCFSYMLDRCTVELPPEMLFPPILHKLIEHDRKKSTSYTETLRAYLENDMKPVKVIKALHIQRSTFLYRLNKINEMIGADLEDEKTKTHLLLSFQLMDKNFLP